MQTIVDKDAPLVDPALQRVVMEALILEDAAVPTRILIAPWGDVRSTAGAFLVDAAAARAVIAAFQEHGTDLPVDYEHQTLGGPYSSPTGQAPAAGWIKALRAVTPEDAGQHDNPDAPGIWADVEWTAEAADQLKSRKYRYLSPVALVRRSDRRLMGIHSVALTNKPAIIGMKPVVNTDAAPVGPACRAGPSAQPAELPHQTLRKALNMDESATDDIVLITAAARIDALETGQRQRDAEACVARAAATGKLTAAQRDWALALALRDPTEFDAWEADAPIVVPLGRFPAPAQTGLDAAASRPASIETSARVEYQTHRAFLEKLCTEEAFVADAGRQTRKQ